MSTTETLDPGKEPTPRRRRTRILTPREFIKKLWAEYPTASAEDIGEHYKRHLRVNTVFDGPAVEALAMQPLEEWLRDNVVEGGTTRRPRAPRSPEEQAQRAQAKEALVATIAEHHEALVEAEVGIRLLEYQTTYGKPLGDCTGAECQRLSLRYGAFFAEVAKRLHRSDHVRQHLTEAELQAIARSHRLIGPTAGR